jgi:hypothetical protein
VVKVLLGVLAVWVIVLVVLDLVYEGRATGRVEDRLGETLQATAKIADSDLALVRGRLGLESLSVRRDDLVGKLAIDVAEVRCELPPLGLALVDRDCRELAIRGLRLEMSTAALFRIQRVKRPPIRAERVVIEDAELVAAPSAFVPSLGQIRIRIERAVTGPTAFRTPLSFVHELRELRARLELPAGITLHLGYERGELSVSGSVFGSTPVRVPIKLPVADAADDARSEIDKLLEFGRDVAERLLAQGATDWLKSKLGP